MILEEEPEKKSLYRAADIEMKRFQKEILWGPEAAAEEWNRKHWWEWARKRWLEHIKGETYWMELGEADFNLVNKGISNDSYLLEQILEKLEIGKENLNIINWAVDFGADMTEVVEILGKLDLNQSRDDIQDNVS